MHIQRPGIAEKLLRALGLREIPQIFLGQSVDPVILVEDLSGASIFDRGYPRDAAGRVSIAAGGANTNAECVWQPGRNLVCVLTSIIIWNSASGGTFQLRLLNSGQVAASQTIETTNKAFYDVRTEDTPGAQIGGKTLNGADGTLVSTIRMLTNTAYQIPLRIVGADLLGGLVVFNDTANQGMETSFFWTEYLSSEGQ